MEKKMYVTREAAKEMNKNTEWVDYPGLWSIYIFILFFSWLLILSLLGCSSGLAWTIVHLSHFIVTYHFFHWKKGTPFSEDQGIYNGLTWWEQIENGQQLTRNRKFFTVVPVLFLVVLLVPGNFYYERIAFSEHFGDLDKCLIVSSITIAICLTVIYAFPCWRYLIASHTTDYQNPMLFLNTLAVFVLVVAKFPRMHRVRIFGINGEQ